MLKGFNRLVSFLSIKLVDFNLKNGITFILFLITSSGTLIAQRNEVIASGCDYFKTNTGSLSWTLGELSIETYTAQSSILTQGFQQTFFKNPVTGITESTDLEMEVYPNPAQDRLYLRLVPQPEMYYVLIDIIGRPLSQQQITQEETLVNLSDLAPAMYLLEIRRGNTLLKIFRIVKK